MTNLVKLLKLHMETNDVNERKLASQLGVAPRILTKLLRSGDMDAKTFAGVVKWLAEDAK
ncbi:hypothetical protein [Amycolatopsis sp. lyj-109]|uniref:hypothetical protein n=1 Tax=Amycolatopsis sp. lyj-109 TaxID=2789287 RepID=UPI0039789219